MKFFLCGLLCLYFARLSALTLDFTIKVIGDTVVCVGGTAQVTANITGGQSPFRYSWSTKDGTQVAENFASVKLSPDTTTVYVLIVKDAANSIQTANFQITVIPKLNVKVTLLPRDVVCNEVVVKLIGSGAASYEWSSQPSIATSALNSTIGDTVLLYTVFLPALSYDIIVTGTDANGCTNTATKKLTVNPLPEVTINPIPDSICVTGAPVKLSGSPDSGGFYTGTCGPCVQGNYFYPQFASLNPLKPNTITHYLKDANGCVNAPSIAINVKDCNCFTPVTIFAGNDLAICENAIAILHGQYTNATSATWSTSGSGQFGDVKNPTTTYSPSFDDFNSGSVVIKFSADAPIVPTCNVRADSFTLTLVKKSLTNIQQNICKGDSIKLKTTWYKQTGSYSDTLSNVYGCDSIVNLSLTVNGIDSIFFYLTSCNAADAGLKYKTLKNVRNCDSVIITSTKFTPYAASTLNKTICAGDSFFFNKIWIKTPNTYTLKTIAVNGCDSTVTLNLRVNKKDTTYLNGTTCDAAQTGILKKIFTNAGGCDSTVITNTQLGASSSILKDSVSCNPRDTGTFISFLSQTGECNKILTTSIRLGKPDFFSLDAMVCFGDSVQLGTQSLYSSGIYKKIFKNMQGCDSTVSVNLTVLKPDTAFVNKISCNPLDTGTDIRALKNAAGCNQYIITKTKLIASTLRADLSALRAASCFGKSDGAVYLKNIGGGTPAYQYGWQNGFKGDTLRNLPVGWYTFSVTDASKCTFTDSVFVQQPPPEILSVTVQSPNCFGQTEGAIQLDTVSGGTPPYVFYFDGNALGTRNFPVFFNKVAIGTHRFTIKDTKSCVSDTAVTVKEPPVRLITLGTNIVIGLGDSTSIGAVFNFQPKKIIWTPSDGLLCDTCTFTYARPIQTTTYVLTLTDSAGCIVSDKFTIFVSAKNHIFIPTAFSPDGNGVNDKFTLYADNSVERVTRMQIYNRWGVLMFQKADFLPNNEADGWNGSFNAGAVVPDIYIYFFEVLFKNGKTEIFSGDVSILR